MTEHPTQRTDPDGEPPQGLVVRDRRRLDPTTGQVRQAAPGGDVGAADGPERTDDVSETDSPPVAGATGASVDGRPGDGEPDDGGLAAVTALADERLVDLQRLQAEYVNYRRRVDRDRDVARDAGVSSVLEALLPVLDDVQLARQHGDLEGTPFAPVADKLEGVLARFGLARYGEAGEEFDPAVHEALLHQHSPDVTGPTVVQVMQPGYTVGEKVLRPARVGVADPEAG